MDKLLQGGIDPKTSRGYKEKKHFQGLITWGKKGGTTAEVSRDIDLKKLNFQGLFEFFFRFFQGV